MRKCVVQAPQSLRRREDKNMSKKPTVLMILDGYGLNDRTDGNAVAQAKTPVMDQLMKEYPFVKGNASGLAVGLPDGQMGNSEVGHMNMGAGRIVYQELTRITKEINDGDFFKNQALLDGMENVKKNNSDLHLYGLLSDGGVHSHITHVYGLLELAKREGIKNVYVHCFLDGRDTAPTSGKGFIEALEAKMAELGVGKIASISGRYYAMDRDNRWDRVEKAYNVLTKGEGEQAESAVAAMDASYAKDVTDEFFVPTAITENGKPVATIKDKDTVIFFNFRPDRARELTRAFCMDEFDGFERGARKNVAYICFTEYDATIPNKEVAFKKVELKNTFGEYLAAHGMKQARIAEEAGACAVMALERIPADIRAAGGVSRMSDPKMIKGIQEAVSIPVMAKCRIGHFAEAQILEAIEIDYIDESEVLSPADGKYHIDKTKFQVPFVCGAKDLGEALRRISEGASMIRTKGEPGTGDVIQAVTHMRSMQSEIRRLTSLSKDELYQAAKDLQVDYELVKYVAENGKLPVVNFAAGGVATPADAALMMQLGAEGVFVGSGIFKSGNPKKRAAAIVKAVTNFNDAKILAELSEDLGEAMVGINEQEIELLMAERGK